jgi:von Willebrand factor A domain-containing protein 8
MRAQVLTRTKISSGQLSITHPSFRIIATASKSIPLKDWLSDEHSNMFFPVPALPMTSNEESIVLRQTGCPEVLVEVLLQFAEKYRSTMTSDLVQKNRKLGTRALIRVASRLGRFSGYVDLYALLSHAVLAEYLPAAEKMALDNIFEELKILKKTPPVRATLWFIIHSMTLTTAIQYNPPPSVVDGVLEFPSPSDPSQPNITPVHVPCFVADADPEGIASHVPHMNHFYDNSLQTSLMRDIAIDMEILGEHLALLGNQGVGKNKIVDR